MNDFYVYLHKYASGPKTGEIFYVGKGRARRASSPNGRNAHWKNIVAKHGFTYEFAETGLSEDVAFGLEQKIVDDIGLENLANLYSGGLGGRVPSERVRARMRAANTLTKDDLKQRGFDKTGVKWSESTRAKLLSRALRAKIGEVQRKVIVCSNGMRFSHGDAVEAWLIAVGKLNASKANVSKCCRGKRKSAYGFKWAFAVSIT